MEAWKTVERAGLERKSRESFGCNEFKTHIRYPGRQLNL